METDISKELVDIGYKSFLEFISDDFNKHLLMKTIEGCINGPEWPKNYYNLRDEFLPEIMGREASSFFFWFALGGNVEDDFYDTVLFENEEVNIFLNYVLYNYSLNFKRAKQFNMNPLGFDRIDFTHSQNRDMFNMYFLRNDSKQFLMSLNTNDFSNMIGEILYYFSVMINEEVVDFKGISDLESVVSDFESTIYDLKNHLVNFKNELEEGEER